MARTLSLLDLDDARHFYAKGWWQCDTMCVDGRYLRTFPMSKLGEAEKLMEVLDFFGKIVLVSD